MTDADLPPTGYPETKVPPNGHLAHEVAMHLLGAISATDEGAEGLVLKEHEMAARRALTVAVSSMKDALMRATWVVVDDLVEPGPEASDEYRRGFRDAQNQVLRGLDALEGRLTGGIKPDVVMLVPDILEPSS